MEDYKAFEEQYKVEGISRNAHPEAEQAGDRLEWAKGLLVEEEEGINRLLTHFQNSLKIVSHPLLMERPIIWHWTAVNALAGKLT